MNDMYTKSKLLAHQVFHKVVHKVHEVGQFSAKNTGAERHTQE